MQCYGHDPCSLAYCGRAGLAPLRSGCRDHDFSSEGRNAVQEEMPAVCDLEA